jgi:type I restriction enzyme M protein
VLEHIDFTARSASGHPDKKLRDLIVHFSKYRLRNEDFEFPDLLGAAYEYLIKTSPTPPARRAASSTPPPRWCA